MAESYPNGKREIVGKGEIARYEQFLLFPQCFQKACFPLASKGVIVWELDIEQLQMMYNLFTKQQNDLFMFISIVNLIFNVLYVQTIAKASSNLFKYKPFHWLGCSVIANEMICH